MTRTQRLALEAGLSRLELHLVVGALVRERVAYVDCLKCGGPIPPERRERGAIYCCRVCANEGVREYEATCPGCGVTRKVAKGTFYDIRRGVRSGRCVACKPARERSVKAKLVRPPRPCVGCGGELSERTPGCHTCSARHSKRLKVAA